MRICLVSQEYPPDTVRGGVGVQTWNKAHALSGLGHDVHVLSVAASDTKQTVTRRQDGVIVHRIPQLETEIDLYQTATYWLGYSWSVLRELRRLMQEQAFDVIDFPEYGAEGFAFQLDRTQWNWVPIVVQLHAPLAMFIEHIGWPQRNSDLARVGEMMEKYSITQADALMSCSANIADFTASHYGIARRDIDVVHCGVDAATFHPLPNSSRTARPVVLFVGNIVHNKGIGVLFEAVLRIRRKHPDVLLRIVGRCEGALPEQLKARAEAEGASGNLEFTGFVHRDGLAAHYQQAAVFCSPAQYEGGVANVYLEAMACACPVIASTAGGAPEAVTDGVTGCLVPPQDASAVADALQHVLADGGLRRRMGQAARARVDEYFAMDKYIQRVLKTYQRAIDNAGRKLRLLQNAENDGD